MRVISEDSHLRHHVTSISHNMGRLVDALICGAKPQNKQPHCRKKVTFLLHNNLILCESTHDNNGLKKYINLQINLACVIYGLPWHVSVNKLQNVDMVSSDVFDDHLYLKKVVFYPELVTLFSVFW